MGVEGRNVHRMLYLQSACSPRHFSCDLDGRSCAHPFEHFVKWRAGPRLNSARMAAAHSADGESGLFLLWLACDDDNWAGEGSMPRLSRSTKELAGVCNPWQQPQNPVSGERLADPQRHGRMLAAAQQGASWPRLRTRSTTSRMCIRCHTID